jgi:prevent-host-death family protein
MPLIGVRELRARTAEILHKIEEEKTEYIITHQGRPVALLLPLEPDKVEAAMLQASKPDASNAVRVYQQLADLLRDRWPASKGTQEMIDEIRRDID